VLLDEVARALHQVARAHLGRIDLLDDDRPRLDVLLAYEGTFRPIG
jgi:hypothetical protein